MLSAAVIGGLCILVAGCGVLYVRGYLRAHATYEAKQLASVAFYAERFARKYSRYPSIDELRALRALPAEVSYRQIGSTYEVTGYCVGNDCPYRLIGGRWITAPEDVHAKDLKYMEDSLKQTRTKVIVTGA
jgi:hypothetical protein